MSTGRLKAAKEMSCFFSSSFWKPVGLVEHLDVELDPGLERLLLQDHEDVLVVLEGRRDGEGEPVPAGVDQDAVRSLLREARLGEILASA